jgi:hypothetical protein
MIVVNQSIGDLTNDILLDFANNNEQVSVFTGVNVEFLVPSENIFRFRRRFCRHRRSEICGRRICCC